MSHHGQRLRAGAPSPSVQAAKFALAVTLVDSDLIPRRGHRPRPVARHLDDGWTREVTRLCTDSTPNACKQAIRRSLAGGKVAGITSA